MLKKLFCLEVELWLVAAAEVWLAGGLAVELIEARSAMGCFCWGFGVVRRMTRELSFGWL